MGYGTDPIVCKPLRPLWAESTVSQLTYVMIEAKPALNVPLAGMPLNLCLLLDRSGSMSGHKIFSMRDAATQVVATMSEADYLSVIIFDDQAEVLIPSQRVKNKNKIIKKIETIRERGGTELHKAIRLGLQEVQKALSSGRSNSMLLLTDGETYRDEQDCIDIAAQAGQMGISITALGLGDEDWNEALLDAVARASHGTSDFVDDPNKITEYFRTAVVAMQGSLMKNVKLGIVKDSDIVLRNCWQVVPSILPLIPVQSADPSLQEYFIGDMAAAGQTYLLELLVPTRASGLQSIGQISMTYDLPITHSTNLASECGLEVSFTVDKTELRKVDTQVAEIVERLNAFTLQTKALDAARAGDVELATRRLQSAATRFLELGEHELASTASAEMQRLQQGEAMSSFGTRKLQYSTRKLATKPDSED